jgi:hypothetical protein
MVLLFKSAFIHNKFDGHTTSVTIIKRAYIQNYTVGGTSVVSNSEIRAFALFLLTAVE